MDKLEFLLEEQHKLTKVIGKNIKWYTEASIDEFLFVKCYAMLEEVVEVIRELSWKPWKPKRKFDANKVKEELIDVLHFWLEVANMLNMSADEIVQIYKKKNEKNKNRKLVTKEFLTNG